MKCDLPLPRKLTAWLLVSVINLGAVFTLFNPRAPLAADAGMELISAKPIASAASDSQRLLTVAKPDASGELSQAPVVSRSLAWQLLSILGAPVEPAVLVATEPTSSSQVTEPPSDANSSMEAPREPETIENASGSTSADRLAKLRERLGQVRPTNRSQLELVADATRLLDQAESVLTTDPLTADALMDQAALRIDQLLGPPAPVVPPGASPGGLVMPAGGMNLGGGFSGGGMGTGGGGAGGGGLAGGDMAGLLAAGGFALGLAAAEWNNVPSTAISPDIVPSPATVDYLVSVGFPRSEVESMTPEQRAELGRDLVSYPYQPPGFWETVFRRITGYIIRLNPSRFYPPPRYGGGGIRG